MFRAMVAVLVLAASFASQLAGPAQASARTPDPYSTTLDYVVRFYPRWLTYYQGRLAPANRLVGPASMSPVFGEVVAPNDDTLYVSSFLDSRRQPLVLTIPRTTVTYSILLLDGSGEIQPTGITAGTPGSYAFVSPHSRRPLPSGVTPVRMDDPNMVLILRADKHAADGSDTLAAAEQFRLGLRLSQLSTFRARGAGAGDALLLPVSLYSTRFKVMADQGATQTPTAFLRLMRLAVHAPSTSLSRSDRSLSRRFDAVWRRARTDAQRSVLADASRAAHALIDDTYLSHTGSTYWTSFQNIGRWGTAYAQRAAIAEYLQYGNGFDTAAYYHAFRTRGGTPLDASAAPGYVLTFPKDQIPQAKRFWSLTAYAPESITLVPNDAQKYLLGSYTPGLARNRDGSISIYLQPDRPTSVPEANWLPVPRGPFNVMLRVYGPQGNVAAGTYTPPGIRVLVRER